tara:strand:- start:5277 stop:5582 length:306 start_codon:yes stop_codon:yes gene_type:complete
MSNGYTETNVPGVHVKSSIDWDKLGRHIADASSTDQAEFLEGWAEQMATWKPGLAELQCAHVGETVNDPEWEMSRDHIVTLLSNLLAFIDPESRERMEQGT